jgi:hypothetical protein
MMTNLELLQTFVRLAQIAEEVEETNPAAAGEIDSFTEAALPGELDQQAVDPEMFPPIKTPEYPEMNTKSEGTKDPLKDQIINEIINSPDWERIEPILYTPEGKKEIKNLIGKKIEEVLGD